MYRVGPIAPVLSGGVAPDPPSAADSPGWLRPLKRAAAGAAVGAAGWVGAGRAPLAALSFAACNSRGCMNLVGSAGEALALARCEPATSKVAFTCPTAGTFEPELNETSGAALVVVGLASRSGATRIGRARRTEAGRRRRRPFVEPRGVPSKVIHPPVMPARTLAGAAPRSPAHDRAAPPVVNRPTGRGAKAGAYRP